MPTIANQFTSAAKASVRAKLRDREDGQESPTGPSKKENPDEVKQELSQILDVGVAYLRAGDRLRDILRIHRSELPANAQPLMEKLGLKDIADPFALDLLHYVEKRIGRDSTRLTRPAFRPPPRSEDEWIERIMDMTVAEFSSALA